MTILKLFDLEGNQTKIVAVVGGNKHKVAIIEGLLKSLHVVTGQKISSMRLFPHIYKPSTKCYAVCLKVDNECQWRFGLYGDNRTTFPEDIRSGEALEVSFDALVSRLQGQVEVWRSGL